MALDRTTKAGRSSYLLRPRRSSSFSREHRHRSLRPLLEHRWFPALLGRPHDLFDASHAGSLLYSPAIRRFWILDGSSFVFSICFLYRLLRPPRALGRPVHRISSAGRSGDGAPSSALLFVQIFFSLLRYCINSAPPSQLILFAGCIVSLPTQTLYGLFLPPFPPLPARALSLGFLKTPVHFPPHHFPCLFSIGCQEIQT